MAELIGSTTTGAFMTIRLELKSGRRLSFDAGPVLLGSDPRCQVHFEPSTGVHSLHARLRQIGGRWMIESQGEWSIKVGGSIPARMFWLRPGDQVVLAREGSEFTFEPVAAASEQPAPSSAATSTPSSAAASPSTPAPSASQARSDKPQISSPRSTPSNDDDYDEPLTRLPLPVVPLALGGGVLLAVAATAVYFFWGLGNDSPTQPTTAALPPASTAPAKRMQGLWELDPQHDPGATPAPVVKPDPSVSAFTTQHLPPDEATLENGPLGLGPSGLGGPPPDASSEPPPPPGAGELSATLAHEESPDLVHLLLGHTHYVTHVAFVLDDQQLVSTGYDKTVRPWDLSTGREMRRRYGHSAAVTGVAVSTDGRWAATGDLQGEIRMWSIDSAEERSFEPSPSSVTSLCFSPDGKQILVGSLNAVHLWDAASGKRLKEIGRHVGFTGALFLGSNQALTFSEDGYLRRFDLATGALAARLEHPGAVGSIAVSSDGRWASSACRDGVVRLWDMQDGGQVRELRGHDSAVHAAAFSPSGDQVLSGGQDRTVRLWDVQTQREIHCFRGHTGAVRHVAFSSDGALAASGGNDRTVRVWSIPGATPKPRPERPAPPKIVVVEPIPKPTDPLVAVPSVNPNPVPSPSPTPSPTSPEPPAVEPKTPALPAPPDAVARAAALKTIRALFQKEYVDRRPDARKSLASALLAQGVDSSNDATTRYVLLTESRDMAVEGHDVQTAVSAVEELAAGYAIDGMALHVQTLTQSSGVLRAAADHQDLARRCLELLQTCVEQDQYDAASTLLTLAASSSRKGGDTTLAAHVPETAERLRELKREFARVPDARAKLKENPEDPAAHLAIGRFLGFYKEDWEQALPHLARSNDADLSALAKLELSQPSKAAEWVQLGDGWYAVAERQAGALRKRLLVRAGGWYEQAVPSLNGLERLRVEKRAAEANPESPTKN